MLLTLCDLCEALCNPRAKPEGYTELHKDHTELRREAHYIRNKKIETHATLLPHPLSERTNNELKPFLCLVIKWQLLNVAVAFVISKLIVG